VSPLSHGQASAAAGLWSTLTEYENHTFPARTYKCLLSTTKYAVYLCSVPIYMLYVCRDYHAETEMELTANFGRAALAVAAANVQAVAFGRPRFAEVPFDPRLHH
jgi:hypothetical protein